MHTLTKLALALPLATALLTGCSVHGIPGVTPKPPAVIQPAQAFGKVSLSFKGLAAYKAQAVAADVDHVAISLTSAAGKLQRQTVNKVQLHQTQVSVSFDNVAVGNVNLDVQAYDASGRQIGEGHGGTLVRSGQVAVAYLSVALTPDSGTGSVTAVIDFFETAPVPVPMPWPWEPACDDARFLAADVNHDGFLDFQEFQALWVREHSPILSPLPAPMPAATLEAASDGPLVSGTTFRCVMPPAPHEEVSPAASLFRSLDTNHDARLSSVEFCAAPGYVGPIPVDPQPATPTPTPTALPAVEALSFDTMDFDRDGHISWSEFLDSHMARRKESAELKARLYDAFRELDTNGNHTLEREEVGGV